MEEEKWVTLCCQTTSTPRYVVWSFEDALETLMWGRVVWELLEWCDSPEMSLVSLHQDWETYSKICWLTKRTLAQPQTQEYATSFARRMIQPVQLSILWWSTRHLLLLKWAGCHVPHVPLGMLSTAQTSATEESQSQYVHSKVRTQILWFSLWSEFWVQEYPKKSQLRWPQTCCLCALISAGLAKSITLSLQTLVVAVAQSVLSPTPSCMQTIICCSQA